MAVSVCLFFIMIIQVEINTSVRVVPAERCEMEMLAVEKGVCVFFFWWPAMNKTLLKEPKLPETIA